MANRRARVGSTAHEPCMACTHTSARPHVLPLHPCNLDSYTAACVRLGACKPARHCNTHRSMSLGSAVLVHVCKQALQQPSSPEQAALVRHASPKSPLASGLYHKRLGAARRDGLGPRLPVQLHVREASVAFCCASWRGSSAIGAVHLTSCCLAASIKIVGSSPGPLLGPWSQIEAD